MNPENISQYRLYSQKITGQRFQNPLEVVSWMGAIQGQDYQGAKWSIGLRTVEATDKDVENALREKTIIRTWLMRGTLHIVSANDLRWILSLVSQRIIAASARRYKELELDTETLVRANGLLEKSLAGGAEISRTHLLAMLNNHGISTQGQRAAYILQRATYDGLIGQGPTLKNVPVYFSLENIKSSKPGSKDENLAALAHRYFISRGPATIADLAWWSGLPLKDCRAGLEACKHKLESELYKGTEYFFSPDLSHAGEKSFHLLPGFDEFLLAYKDRIASIDPKHSGFWCPGNNGMFFPYIVCDGRVTGTWKKKEVKKKVEFTTSAFEPTNGPQDKRMLEATRQYFRFLSIGQQ